MEVSSVEGKNNNNRFSLSFYFGIADQLIKQAKVCRNEGNSSDLCTILDRYCRLITKISQHSSYLTYFPKEKSYHSKMHQDFVKELGVLKSELSQESWTRAKKGLLSYDGLKVENGISEATKDRRVNVSCVTQSSPSPILTYIQDVPEASPILTYIQDVPEAAQVSHIVAFDSRDCHSQSSYQDVHLSVRLMDDFLELARDNTNKDLETCGILGAFLKNGTFYVTTLIIPKQETTSSSCQALNEEEIYAIQSEHSLFPLGWIHTHPSQTCFMSSIDLHTQYCYQTMLPEAVAIVMAPTDTSRNYGIFRLSEPGGTTVLKECQERGFHPHQEPSDGSPIYEDSSNVYFNPNLRFEIFDLR